MTEQRTEGRRRCEGQPERKLPAGFGEDGGAGDVAADGGGELLRRGRGAYHRQAVAEPKPSLEKEEEPQQVSFPAAITAIRSANTSASSM